MARSYLRAPVMDLCLFIIPVIHSVPGSETGVFPTILDNYKIFSLWKLPLPLFFPSSVSNSLYPLWNFSFCSAHFKIFRDFPGGRVVKNPPANAGDTGSSPGPGRSHMPWSNEAHAPQLLSLCSRAREPQLLSPSATTTEICAPKSPCSATREATAMRSPRTTTKSSPCSPQLEKAHAQQQRPNAAKRERKQASKLSNLVHLIWTI